MGCGCSGKRTRGTARIAAVTTRKIVESTRSRSVRVESLSQSVPSIHGMNQQRRIVELKRREAILKKLGKKA